MTAGKTESKVDSQNLKGFLTHVDMKPKIGLITIQEPKNVSAFETYLKFVNIFNAFSSEIVWVATSHLGDEKRLPKNVTLIKLEPKHIDAGPLIKRIIPYFLREMQITFALRKLKDIDIFAFYCGYVPLFPIIFTKLILRKKSILRIVGRSSTVLKSRLSAPADLKNRWIRLVAHALIEKVAYALVDKILVQYESSVARFNLQPYQHKIALGSKYVDTALFKKERDLKERPFLLGFFGRLSDEKGILEFARALPLILKDQSSRALIVGGGDLEGQVRKILADAGIQDRVQFTGWVNLNQMPAYLNDTGMVVVPSYGEGVPNTILEAMACGTPVLATPVGGIPDVIKDGDNGFLMEGNSPECIARNVIRVINHPDIEGITRKARALIDKEYTYEVAVERYRNIIMA